MEILKFEFSAGHIPTKQVLVGYVGSGDLEVLMKPNPNGIISIEVTTSVDGSELRWKNVLERMFTDQTPPAVQVDIHDFGATPGVVRLRLEQAFEEMNNG